MALSRAPLLLCCFLLSCGSLIYSAQSLSATDTAVLNFALNLEYLEANFYSCAAYGKPISEDLWIGGNNQSGKAPVGCGSMVKNRLSKTALKYATEIAKDEIGHVKILKAVLGAAAVPMPLIDIGPAFRAAANAAVKLALGSDSFTLSPVFSPYASDLFFYHGAFIFEDVGVTAYAGAAALIEDKGILTAAAQILAVEAYHAGAVRTLLFQSMSKQAFSSPKLLVRDVVGAISNLRDAVDGADDIDQGIVGPAGGINIVPTDGNHLAYTRDTKQVLKIVYLGGDASGGFFPEGLNGDIK